MPRTPSAFYGFIGQGKIISSIKRLVDGCQKSGQPLPHMLLTGSSGSGKTELASAIAKAMGVNLHHILCGREVKRLDIAKTLANVKFADILFFDEVHALPHQSAELLYPAMDEYKTFEIETNGKREVLTQEWTPIQPCTIVVATDRAGELRNALRRRTPQMYSMADYTKAELREIAAHRASEIDVLLSPQSCTALAKVSRGIPRNIKHMLHSLKLYFPECVEEAIGKKHVQEYLQNEQVDSLGLTTRDRNYISVLCNRGNRQTSLSSLALAMGCDSDFVAYEIEPYLVKLGLVSIDKGGRTLTAEGLGYAVKGENK